MIQMLGQVVLSVVLIVWGYQVASRVRRRPAWLWPGVGAAVIFGFLALTAVYVAEGASAAIRNVAATVASVLYVIVVVLCVALFVAVSRAATRPVQAESENAPSRSMWEPDDDQPPVIVDDTPWHPGVIDAGTAPRRAARAYEETPEHKFASPEEPVPGHVPDQAVVSEPAAPLHRNSAESSADQADDDEADDDDDDDDDEAWQQVKPRRAMSPEPDPGRLDEG